MKPRYEENFPLDLIDEANEEFQARLDYDEEELESLKQDIAQNGQRNPVGLVQKGDRYQIIYGFQRVKAIRRLGWDSVRANIYEDATEKAKALIAAGVERALLLDDVPLKELDVIKEVLDDDLEFYDFYVTTFNYFIANMFKN